MATLPPAETKEKTGIQTLAPVAIIIAGIGAIGIGLWLFMIDVGDGGDERGGGTSSSRTVSITQPQEGATVSGTVRITAQPSGVSAGVYLFQFFRATSVFINSKQCSIVSSGNSCSIDWDTTTVADGGQTLTVKLLGLYAGLLATSGPRTVTVQNTVPPTGNLTITQPAAGATVSGTNVPVSAQHNNLTAGFVYNHRFFLDQTTSIGRSARSCTSATECKPAVKWNSTTTSNGSHALDVRALRCDSPQGLSKATTVHSSGWNSGALAGIGTSQQYIYGGGYVSKASNAQLLNGGVRLNINTGRLETNCGLNCELSSCTKIPGYDTATLLMFALQGSTNGTTTATGPEKDLPLASLGGVKLLQTYANWVFGQCSRTGGAGTPCTSCANFISNDWPYAIEFSDSDFTTSGTTKNFVIPAKLRLFENSPVDDSTTHNFGLLAVTASKYARGTETILQVQTDQTKCYNSATHSGACFTLRLVFNANGQFSKYEWDASGEVPSYYDVLFNVREQCSAEVPVDSSPPVNVTVSNANASGGSGITPIEIE